MTTKKKIEPIASNEISLANPTQSGASNYADNFINGLDQKKISRLEKEVKELKDLNSKKVYAVKFSLENLNSLIQFIENECEWSQTESLGVIEIHKELSRIKKEGVKDNTIFLNALPLEATHYFISKSKGKGLTEAQNFIQLYKPLSIAVEEVKKDAIEVQGLEKELAAAQQGIETV
jgi:hypothetical protein